MSNIIGNPNDWSIQVIPKRAGEFGSSSIGFIEYSKQEAEQLMEEMQEAIKRHVDKVKNTYAEYNSYICTECEERFITRIDADSHNCK